MKPIFNKWQFFINHHPCYTRMDYAWYEFHIAFVKLVDKPAEGEVIQRKHYRGIWIKFMYWFPIRPLS